MKSTTIKLALISGGFLLLVGCATTGGHSHSSGVSAEQAEHDFHHGKDGHKKDLVLLEQRRLGTLGMVWLLSFCCSGAAFDS